MESVETTLAHATSSGDLDATRDAGAELPRGTTIGRFVLLERLGAGGMGVVYAAYDPELDRKLALKVLRDTGSERHRARLLREAQSLAQLNDPNVVTVHDAGCVDGRVFVAMEFVAGTTLSAWLRERPRSWREVLAVMIPAARGLAVAHRAGLVHRDFKPDNMMLGTDGRVRVMDFGLARRSTETSTNTGVEFTAGESSPASLGLTGALAGTPRYMAPEQFLGGEVDGRTDQFSYSVALFEALWGERAFLGDNPLELAAAVTQGRVRRVTNERGVPAWLRAIVLRGLAVDREQRHPSMDALVAALGRDRSGHRRAWLIVAVAVVAIAGVLGLGQLLEARRAAACEREGAAIESVWGAETRTEIHSALVATASIDADDTWTRLAPRLDAYAASWHEIRRETCMAEPSSDALTEHGQRTLACLDEVRAALQGFIVALAEADPAAVRKALSSAAYLPAPARCGDPRWLLQRIAPPAEPELARAVAEARDEIEQGWSRSRLGDHDHARAASQRVLDGTAAQGWPPLRAEAHLLLGRAESAAGHPELAEAALEQAFSEAGAAGADEIALSASAALAVVVGVEHARAADGMRWLGLARMWLARLGGDEARAIAVEIAAGKLAYARGDFEAAETDSARAEEFATRVLGEDHPEVVAASALRALAAAARGRLREALASFEHASAIIERTVGPDHIDMAEPLDNIAMVYYELGELDAALGYLQRALAIRERVYGGEHPEVATALNNLGLLQSARGALDEAMAAHQRALAIKLRIHGEQHPSVGASQTNLGLLYERLGDSDKALAAHQRALAIDLATRGEDHPHTATSLANVGDQLRGRGRFAEAAEHFRRAIVTMSRSHGATHVTTVRTEVALAECELELGQLDDARRRLERALASLELPDVQPRFRARGRFALARTLWVQGHEYERERALLLARRALVERREDEPETVAEIEAWLASRASP